MASRCDGGGLELSDFELSEPCSDDVFDESSSSDEIWAADRASSATAAATRRAAPGGRRRRARAGVAQAGQERAGGSISGPLGVLGLRGGGRGHGDAAGGSPARRRVCEAATRRETPVARAERGFEVPGSPLPRALAFVWCLAPPKARPSYLNCFRFTWPASATTLWLSAFVLGSEAVLRAVRGRSPSRLSAFWGLGHFAPRRPFLLREDAQPGRSMAQQGREGRLRRLVEGLTLASVTLHLVRLGRTGPKR